MLQGMLCLDIRIHLLRVVVVRHWHFCQGGRGTSMLEGNLPEVTLSNVIEPQRWTELQQALPSKLFQNFRISAWQSRYLRQFIQCKYQPTMDTNRKDFKLQKNFALSWRIRTATIRTCIASKPSYHECFNYKSGQKVSGQEK